MPDELAAVELRRSGAPLQAIAESLNAEGPPTKRGGGLAGGDGPGGADAGGVRTSPLGRMAGRDDAGRAEQVTRVESARTPGERPPPDPLVNRGAAQNIRPHSRHSAMRGFDVLCGWESRARRALVADVSHAEP